LNELTLTRPQFFFMQRFVPISPGKTAVRYEVYRNKHVTEEAFQFVSNMYKRVMTEDKALCTAAQKNLDNGVFVNGEMHPKMEKGPLYFQKLVRETVTDFHKREQTEKQEIWPARQRLPGSASASAQDIEFCSGLSCTDKESLAW